MKFIHKFNIYAMLIGSVIFQLTLTSSSSAGSSITASASASALAVQVVVRPLDLAISQELALPQVSTVSPNFSISPFSKEAAIVNVVGDPNNSVFLILPDDNSILMTIGEGIADPRSNIRLNRFVAAADRTFHGSSNFSLNSEGKLKIAIGVTSRSFGEKSKGFYKAEFLVTIAYP